MTEPEWAKIVANWMINDVSAALHERKLTFSEDGKAGGVGPEDLWKLIQLVEVYKWITRASGRVVLGKMMDTGKSALEIIVDDNLWIKSDGVEAMVDAVIQQQPKLVADYVAGKDKVINAILGKCMAETKGTGDPAVIKPILEAKLAALRPIKKDA
jgi:aspartyl-tRNA(Asn)/glutamyl-tRNA(Gln) amidotransferase subunit B